MRTAFSCFLSYCCLVDVGALETILDSDQLAADTDIGDCSSSIRDSWASDGIPTFCAGEDNLNSEKCREWVKCVKGRNRLRDVQDALHSTYRFFEPRPVSVVYYAVGIVLLTAFVFLVSRKRRLDQARRLRNQIETEQMPCYFLAFQRPAVGQEAPLGLFHPTHCPPVCRRTLQPWYQMERKSIYSLVSAAIPETVWHFAVTNACLAGLIWTLFHFASRKKWLKEAFITFHGDGDWFRKETNVWKIFAEDFSVIGGLFKTMLAFFLLYMVRQRLRWMEGLKTKIWMIKRKVELTSFLAGGFIIGNEEKAQRTRHEIYRWLMAAFFFSSSARSTHLSQYSVSDLLHAGILSEDELNILVRCMKGPGQTNQRERLSLEEALQTGREIRSVQEAEKKVECLRQVDSCCRARDRLLWWVQVRILAACNEKILEKEHKKKLLGVLWNTRDAMEDLVCESGRSQMFLWVAVMQLMVDCFLVTIPFNSLADMYHGHIWTLPLMMLRVFVVSFFYDVLLQIAALLQEPFAGNDLDDLNMDPVLIATERQVFFNLGQNESDDMPTPLSQTWQAVKDIKDKDEDKEKKKKENDNGKAEKAADTIGEAKEAKPDVDPLLHQPVTLEMASVSSRPLQSELSDDDSPLSSGRATHGKRGTV